MDTIPQRVKITSLYRRILDAYEDKLFLPVKNPNFYQVLSLLLSMIFLFKPSTLVSIVLIIIILLSDWMDGAVARKYKLVSREGWVIDVVVDRISEGLMFVMYLGTFIGNALFSLYLVNILLSFYSIKTGRQFLLALRFYYLLYLIFVAVQ